MKSHLKNFAFYRDEIARRLHAPCISEALVTWDNLDTISTVDEHLAQCIWFDSMFVHQNLRTNAGQILEIIQPGRWNRGEGPDFQGARLRINGTLLSGDVEIHLQSSGWRRHRHHLNPLYDSVILHAHLWRDETASETVRNSLGAEIPAFVMEPYLFPDLESIRQTVHPEDYPYDSPSSYGRCRQLMCQLEDDFLEQMLAAAGRERMESKVRRYSEQSSGETLEQVLYQSIMTAMGLKSSKSLFFLLSKRAPLNEMLDYRRDLTPEDMPLFFETILLNVAQLVPNTHETTLLDPESAHYCKKLERIWNRIGGYYTDRIIPPTKRWTTGVRPVNFAYRRFAGIASLLNRWFLGGKTIERLAEIVLRFNASQPLSARRRWIQEELVAPFVVDDEANFWAWRYTFSAKRAARSMKLIGQNRAESIVFNAILPILLIHSRSVRDHRIEECVNEIFASFPPLESNSIVRHMQTRLFGDHPRGKTLLNSESRQQALFQIFSECCHLNEKSCDDCYYLTQPDKENEISAK